MQKVKALILKHFDGVGGEVDYETIVRRYSDAARMELYSISKIVKLNIRFDELFHRCVDTEWEDYMSFLRKQSVAIHVNRWWQFYDR
jgi:hypothetical protein